MSQQPISVEPGIDITLEDATLLHRYLTESWRFSGTDWRRMLMLMDQLNTGQVIFRGRRYTWRRFYNTFINGTYARPFLRQIGVMEDLSRDGDRLTAEIARRIVGWLIVVGLDPARVEHAEYLQIFCLYWWTAFARGYLFEDEILRDLRSSSVAFTAHNVQRPSQRFTSYDLLVMGMRGDLKTSIYFLDALVGAYEVWKRHVLERQGKGDQ